MVRLKDKSDLAVANGRQLFLVEPAHVLPGNAALMAAGEQDRNIDAHYIEMIVITSYSIHYTKLYDTRPGGQSGVRIREALLLPTGGR